MAVKVLQYNQGRTIIVKGSVNDGYFFIVQSGTISVSSGQRFSEKELSRFEPGDTFGLVSAFTDKKYLATLVAKTDVALVRVPVSELGTFLRDHREICMKMLRLYSMELRALDHHLSEINAKSQYDSTPVKLFMDAQTYEKLEHPELSVYGYARFLKWLENGGQASNDFKNKAQERLAELNSGFELPIRGGNKVTLTRGEVLFLENEPSDNFYVLTRGAVRLFKLVHDKIFLIGRLSNGQIFGEMSLLDKKPRMASAVAVEDSELIRLSESNFMDLIGEKLLQTIFESLARRIWFTHQRIPLLRIPDAQARLYFCLHALAREQVMIHRLDPDKEHRFEFPISLDDLKRMCGLLKVADEKLSPVLDDGNLEFGDQNITVKGIKDLQAKLYTLKTRLKTSGSFR